MSDAADPDSGLRQLVRTESTRQYLSAIWKRRDFVTALPVEHLKTAHLDTAIGNLWHLANPLLTAGIYYVIFGIMFDTRGSIPNYILWLVIGVFTYGFTASSVLGGAQTINDSQGLMRSFRFPRAIIPISNVITHLLAFGFQFAVIILFTFGSGIGPTRRWLALPLILAVHTALNLGGAFVAARLNDAFQDVQQLIPFFFRLLQYTSGVMFPITRFLGTSNGFVRAAISYNPLVPVIDMYRWAMIGTTISVRTVAIGVAEAAALLVFGFRYFRAAEHRYGKP